jgi:2-isopropylmalate synthase
MSLSAEMAPPAPASASPAAGAAELQLFHDWSESASKLARTPAVADETLRDGLQSPSVRDPVLEDKVALLHHMDRLGIEAADIGLPGAHGRQFRDALALAKEIATARLRIAPYCAARTRSEDVAPIVEISQRAGLPVDAAIFIGSSPIRQYVEGWSLDDLKRWTEESVTFAVAHGLSVMFVTEDTTRSRPDVLRDLYRTAVRSGARRLCICDTVGHATPSTTAAIVRFVREIIAEQGEEIELDWHGHRDRGLDVANSLEAWRAGADRCHGTALGLGERCGNTPIELLLVNRRLWLAASHDLSTLNEYVDLAARALGVRIPPNHPVVGRDAFRTATGTHAAAVLKAKRRGDEWIAERVYSAIPASIVGQRQTIEVGPMSGQANVRAFLEERGLGCAEWLVQAIVALAKSRDGILSEQALQEAATWDGPIATDHASRREP